MWSHFFNVRLDDMLFVAECGNLLKESYPMCKGLVVSFVLPKNKFVKRTLHFFVVCHVERRLNQIVQPTCNPMDIICMASSSFL
jgi:hypothetical protein